MFHNVKLIGLKGRIRVHSKLRFFMYFVPKLILKFFEWYNHADCEHARDNSTKRCNQTTGGFLCVFLYVCEYECVCACLCVRKIFEKISQIVDIGLQQEKNSKKIKELWSKNRKRKLEKNINKMGPVLIMVPPTVFKLFPSQLLFTKTK